jgi:hypothetical protein
LKPNKEQKEILENWASVTRYVYNKILDKVKKENLKLDNDGMTLLTKQCITVKNNNIIKDKMI